ncbi:MAG: class I SAM-dependent methyltransferase [Bacillota bacterium]|jgi:glycine/sarcosine N-methyltransferase
MFYDEIAQYYDLVFPAGKAQISFLMETAGRPQKSILDIACGTGAYALELAKAGYFVTAVDLDAEMIDILKKKTLEESLETKINPIQGNMLELPQRLKAKYELAFCIGNSLVHLDGEKEIEEFLSGIKSLLVDSGHLVIQIINYDRVLEKNIKSLPTIEVKDKELKFHRLYRYDAKINKIFFKTILEVPGNVIENEIPLYPLVSDDLETLLQKSGFTDIQVFGDFQKTKFQKDSSYSLVVNAS